MIDQTKFHTPSSMVRGRTYETTVVLGRTTSGSNKETEVSKRGPQDDQVSDVGTTGDTTRRSCNLRGEGSGNVTDWGGGPHEREVEEVQ